MLGVKKLNNNFALCRDSTGAQVIAYGKGVGFGKFPCEIPLEKLDATYYNVNAQMLALIENLPEDVFQVSKDIVRYAQQISHKPIPGNFVFSLTDHIQFAIERQKKGITVKIPFVYEVEHLYETEYAIGKYALKQILRRLKVRLPKDEITGIALHFINNYQEYGTGEEGDDFDCMLERILKIIEQQLGTRIDRGGYDCYRFSAHMRYFVKRADDQALYQDDGNNELYQHMCREYPKVYACMQAVVEYLQPLLDIQCSEEEQLYLMIHINRLCTNEDCNR